MNEVLSCENLIIGYGKRIVADNITLSLTPDRATALIGRNGAGKSTLLKTLTRHIPALGGEIRLLGKNIEDYSRRELSRLISVVDTSANMAGGLRVEELVALGRIPYTGRFGKLKAEDKRIIESAMQMTGIIHKRDNFVAELSDGERQRAMIAKSLAQQTPIMVMDEPFSFLDAVSRLRIMTLLQEIADNEKRTILFSTHEVSEALRFINDIWLFVNQDDKMSSRVINGRGEELIERGEINRVFDNGDFFFEKNSKLFERKI